MKTRVCLAGATGWAGSALARGIARAGDLDLVAGVSRSQAGRRLGDVLGVPSVDAVLRATAIEALATPCDVFVEYTRPEIARSNIAAAIGRGAHVVIATSGLSDEDLGEIGDLASRRGVGALAVGNFSLAQAVQIKCAELAARHLPQWEILDYAGDAKPDAPSGTTRELAYRVSRVKTPVVTVPIERTQGPVESRGATLQGTQVHSVRLPGYVIASEILFGWMDQRLSLRYDAGNSPEPYVDGALLAIRKVGSFKGLRRGLDSVMDF